MENRLYRYARKMLREGELENATAALSAKDLVDRLQDMIGDVGKMSNDELPHVIDAIRSSFGPDAATSYATSANNSLNNLLSTLKNKKAELENATLVLTGDASVVLGNGSTGDLILPDEAQEDKSEKEALKADEADDDALLNSSAREKREVANASESIKIARASIQALTEELKKNTEKVKRKRIQKEVEKLVKESSRNHAILAKYHDTLSQTLKDSAPHLAAKHADLFRTHGKISQELNHA